jgi:hypothetical protein
MLQRFVINRREHTEHLSRLLALHETKTSPYKKREASGTKKVNKKVKGLKRPMQLLVLRKAERFSNRLAKRIKFSATSTYVMNWRNYNEGTRFTFSLEDAHIVANYPHPLVMFIMIEFGDGTYNGKLAIEYYENPDFRADVKKRYFVKNARWTETFEPIPE